MNRAFFYTVGSAKLPYKRRLAYLESTGTQWLDTRYFPNPNTVLDLDFQWVNAVGNGTGNVIIFGAQTGGSPDWGLFVVNKGGQAVQHEFFIWNQLANGHGGVTKQLPSGGWSGGDVFWNRTTLHIEKSSASAWGSTIALAGKTTTQVRSLYLLAQNNGSTPAPLNCYGMRIYGLTLKENGVLIRDFIPALDWDNVPCMYDRVSSQFFYNQGTGQFNYA